ncbi:hypothetical protein HNY73_018675 [Argiope bruennichi]|uniref:Uncharacterized protein n=1 Tax=Argiope bruennichi TaxID=94029 RepID=A0A8T0EIR1_ARGBR|nr:hypothetical protein HNY73_018675 [Argiope bruennichi]
MQSKSISMDVCIRSQMPIPVDAVKEHFNGRLYSKSDANPSRCSQRAFQWTSVFEVRCQSQSMQSKSISMDVCIRSQMPIPVDAVKEHFNGRLYSKSDANPSRCSQRAFNGRLYSKSDANPSRCSQRAFQWTSVFEVRCQSQSMQSKSISMDVCIRSQMPIPVDAVKEHFNGRLYSKSDANPSRCSQRAFQWTSVFEDYCFTASKEIKNHFLSSRDLYLALVLKIQCISLIEVKLDPNFDKDICTPALKGMGEYCIEFSVAGLENYTANQPYREKPAVL